MKLYFFRGFAPNFGDELNLHLIPRVFPDFFDEDESTQLLAIGSIISTVHPPDVRKIVFGSGFGGYTAVPELDNNWIFYCVRGPWTAQVCGLPASKVAADAAVLINRFRTPSPAKTIRCSFMPHWESMGRGHWKLACKLAGIHFIDPRRPVPDVLAQIEASEMIVTEAMHGAIVADALRVPWVAAEPLHQVHRAKWLDWAGALDLALRPVRLQASSAVEERVAAGGAMREGELPSGRVRRAGRNLRDLPHVARAALSLRRAAAQEPSLSRDDRLASAVEKLEENAAAIMRDFPR